MDRERIKREIQKYDEIVLEDKETEFENKQKKYFADILPLYESEFIENNSQEEKYDVMLSLLGMSPATTVLAVNTIKPKYLYIVGTERSLKKFKKYIIPNLKNISEENVKELEITESNLVKNYEYVMEKLKNLYDKKKIIIDVTGGKKSMTSLAQIISTNLNIDTCYVDSKIYDSNKRRPEFGTEFLELFKNPLYFTGEKYIKDAIKLFNRQRFTSAATELEKVKKSNKNYFYAELYGAFINAYNSWHCFNYFEAKKCIELLLRDYKNELKEEQVFLLKSHVEILTKIIEEKDLKSMIFNFYFSAERYAMEGQFDVSVFLIYRTVEFVLAEILIREFEFNPSEANFEKIGIDFISFKNEANKVFKKGYKWETLPLDCGLMDNAIILSLKKHNVLNNIKLTEIKEKSTLRNNSVFTHGESLLTVKESDTLKKLLRTMIFNLYPKMKESSDWDHVRNVYSFPKLDEDII